MPEEPTLRDVSADLGDIKGIASTALDEIVFIKQQVAELRREVAELRHQLESERDERERA